MSQSHWSIYRFRWVWMTLNDLGWLMTFKYDFIIADFRFIHLQHNYLFNHISAIRVIPFQYVFRNQCLCDNCRSEYWSYGWRLVQCCRKFHKIKIEIGNQTIANDWYFLEWNILGADDYNSNDDVCWIRCDTERFTSVHEMGQSHFVYALWSRRLCGRNLRWKSCHTCLRRGIVLPLQVSSQKMT